MNIINIIESLKGHHGQNIRASWQKSCKLLQGYAGNVVTKTTVAVVRGGIDYANLASVREGIASGERDEVQSLPWGEWAQFPVHITHRGADYVRLYPPTGGISQMPKVQWQLNGEPVEYAAIEHMLLASEKPKGEKPDCFTVKAENIVSIGR